MERKECACPECGCEMLLHGGIEWVNGPTQCDEDEYIREFDGSFVSEFYTCEECGCEWEVVRDLEDEYAEDLFGNRLDFNTLCPNCDVEEVEHTSWGEETLMGDRIEVEMECLECGASWTSVFVLGEPYLG